MEPQMLQDSLGLLETPASDHRTPEESLRPLFWVQLEMRFGGNPIEGSNPSLSATLYKRTFGFALAAARG